MFKICLLRIFHSSTPPIYSVHSEVEEHSVPLEGISTLLLNHACILEEAHCP